MRKHSIAALSFWFSFVVLLGAHADAATDATMPVSASRPPAIAMNANTTRVAGSNASEDVVIRPELLGAAAIGAYALLRSRRRRIL